MVAAGTDSLLQQRRGGKLLYQLARLLVDLVLVIWDPKTIPICLGFSSPSGGQYMIVDTLTS